MKRYLVLLCVLCGLLSSCSSTPPETSSYDLYFPNKSMAARTAALGVEPRSLPKDSDPVEGLLKALLAGPTHESLRQGIPEGATLQRWNLEEGVLNVDFTGWYGSLSGIDLTLADYSIALTLGQLPTVDAVRITVEGEELSYRDHALLKPEDVSLLVYRSEPLQRKVTLYFPRADGSGLLRETRMVDLTEDATLTFAVLQALAEGTGEKDALGILSSSEIRAVQVRDGICYLDLAASFAELAPEQESMDRLTIYALVNTLCALDGVEAVRFLSEGEPMSTYGTMNLTEPLGEGLLFLP